MFEEMMDVISALRGWEYDYLMMEIVLEPPSFGEKESRGLQVRMRKDSYGCIEITLNDAHRSDSGRTIWTVRFEKDAHGNNVAMRWREDECAPEHAMAMRRLWTRVQALRADKVAEMAMGALPAALRGGQQ